jgi:hypothetical protein
VPFLVVAIWGLFVVTSSKFRVSPIARWESWPYIVFFLGLALTFLGSSYYHLQPTNFRLMWDRLPMTLGFMGILCGTIAERISLSAGIWLLLPLVLLGLWSVGYWYWTETRGQGDLRAYYLVQFGSLVGVLAVLVLFRPRYTRSWCLVLALILYTAAKLAETLDSEIYKVTQVISGHTLKHLAAAAAGFFIVLMLQGRTAVRVDSKEFHMHHSSVSKVPAWTGNGCKQRPFEQVSTCRRVGPDPWHTTVAGICIFVTVPWWPKGTIVGGYGREYSC